MLPLTTISLWRSGRLFSVHFQALMIKEVNYKDYNKRITTRDNGNVQSHDQEYTITWSKVVSRCQVRCFKLTSKVASYLGLVARKVLLLIGELLPVLIWL